MTTCDTFLRSWACHVTFSSRSVIYTSRETAMARSACCPDCGGELSWERGIQGLCPQCLLSLALEESELEGQKTEVVEIEVPALRATPTLVVDESALPRTLAAAHSRGRCYSGCEEKRT